MSIERDRLKSKQHRWRRWGPYVSDRAWGTVREDYSLIFTQNMSSEV